MRRQCVVCEAILSGKQQKYCSNACKQKHHYDRVKSQTNTYHSQTIRALRRKRKLVEMKGGGCSKCGFNANFAALEFHHVDSNLKDFKLDLRILSNRKWETILQEADKCILLCANCHVSIHHPELTPENIDRIINTGASGRKLSDEQGVNSGEPASE